VNFLKRIPAPLVVLLVSILMAMAFGLKNTDDFKPLLTFDKGFFDILGVNVSFAGFQQTGTFIKFVIMFALVGSLEALLTVKAIDMMDPFKRKSNYNKDLIAVGLGNIISGVFGGLPMISEVARSSANVNNGGRTRWANLFHGIFILIFLIFAISFSNLIPMTALAAMLIGVGWKLAHPKEFGHMLKIGPDQLVVFLTTIIVTLATDLLVGIAAGILLKIILHLFSGVSLKSIFKAQFTVTDNVIHVKGSIVFSNFLTLQAVIQKSDYTEQLHVDVTKVDFIDHSSMEALHHLEDDFKSQGGVLDIIGLHHFENVLGSTHQLAARKRK
jgi:MFS superfamily sulfate permease-like transporter